MVEIEVFELNASDDAYVYTSYSGSTCKLS